MDKEKITQELVDFVEGRVSFEVFWDKYESGKDYKKLLDDKKPNEKFTYQKGKTINQCLSFYLPSTALGKMAHHSYIVRYLEFYNVLISPTAKYKDDYKYRQAIQPSYVSIEDEEYLNSIIASAPSELTEAQQKKWLKEKIKSLFRYDKSPPRWIQDPEWPIVNGKPLVFRSQTKNDPNDERIWYTFYDSDTGEEVKIMQFY